MEIKDPNNDTVTATQKILQCKNRLNVTVKASKNGKIVEGLIPKTFLSGNSITIKDVLAKPERLLPNLVMSKVLKHLLYGRLTMLGGIENLVQKKNGLLISWKMNIR